MRVELRSGKKVNVKVR